MTFENRADYGPDRMDRLLTIAIERGLKNKINDPLDFMDNEDI